MGEKEKDNSGIMTCLYENCGRTIEDNSKFCIFHLPAEEKDEKELWHKCMKAFYEQVANLEKDVEADGQFNGFILKDVKIVGREIKGTVSFENSIFIGESIFSSLEEITTFNNKVNFNRATFRSAVSFDSATFLEEVSFDKTLFIGLTYFTDTTFEKHATFNNSEFQERADFEKAHFHGHTSFSKADFGNIAYFRGSKFKYIASFKDIHFQQGASFVDTIFGHISWFNDAKFIGGTRFTGVTFNNASFTRVTFGSSVDFIFATFKGKSDFNEAIFKGNAVFNDAIFSDRISFTKTHFLGVVNFNNAVFHKHSEFNGGVFEGDANFGVTIYHSAAIFNKSKFLSSVFFHGTRFSDQTEFCMCSFQDYVDFNGSNFNKKADFNGAKFQNVDFMYASFFGDVLFENNTMNEADFTGSFFHQGGSFRSSKIRSGSFKQSSIQYVSFDSVKLNNISFSGARMEFAYFSNSIWEPFRTEKQRMTIRDIFHFPNPYIIREENEGNTFPDMSQDKLRLLQEAQSTYRQFKISLSNEGASELAGEFFIREKETQRKIIKNQIKFILPIHLFIQISIMIYNKLKGWKRGTKDFYSIGLYIFTFISKVLYQISLCLRYIIQLILYRIGEYGERPGKIAWWGFVFIALFTFIYVFSDAYYNTIEDVSIDDSNGGLDYLYFSVVTFTTLGYGDLKPLGYIRLFAATEAIIGALMIAYFIVSITRKVMR